MKQPITGDEINELRDYCTSFGSVGSLIVIQLLGEIERQRAALRRLVDAAERVTAGRLYCGPVGFHESLVAAAAEARRVLGEG